MSSRITRSKSRTRSRSPSQPDTEAKERALWDAPAEYPRVEFSHPGYPTLPRRRSRSRPRPETDEYMENYYRAYQLGRARVSIREDFPSPLSRVDIEAERRDNFLTQARSRGLGFGAALREWEDLQREKKEGGTMLDALRSPVYVRTGRVDHVADVGGRRVEKKKTQKSSEKLKGKTSDLRWYSRRVLAVVKWLGIVVAFCVMFAFLKAYVVLKYGDGERMMANEME